MLVAGTMAAGLLLLVAGAELLVRGASRLAAAFRISPLVIGLTVVAFGTSAPEMAVSLQAGFEGHPDLAIGNVVGSNIFNVLFILGVCALILPLIVSVALVRREVPVMIGASVLVYVLALDGALDRGDGAILFGGLILWVTWSIIAGRGEARDPEGGEEEALATIAADGTSWRAGAVAVLCLAVIGWTRSWFDSVVAAFSLGGAAIYLAGAVLARSRAAKIAGVLGQLGFVAVGLSGLLLGAGYLIASSSAVARALGIGDLVIGLTIVAAGTSLPEVATSVVATIRNQRDIAIGNVVGSNVFNILAILGLTAILVPGGLSVDASVLAFDLPVMVAVAVACLPIFFTGFRIARWEGALFLAGYVAYTTLLLLAATRNPALGSFRNAMLLTAPLVVIVLAGSTWMAIRAQRKIPTPPGANAKGAST